MVDTQVINDPLDALNAIWDAAITQGDQVKTQIGSTVSSFRGSTDSIKKNIVDNLAMAQRDYKPLTTQYDGYRYSVSGPYCLCCCGGRVACLGSYLQLKGVLAVTCRIVPHTFHVMQASSHGQLHLHMLPLFVSPCSVLADHLDPQLTLSGFVFVFAAAAAAPAAMSPLCHPMHPLPPQGSVALYAVSVVLVVLLFCCSFVNYHFGATFLTLLLTVVTVLYLLLAFVIALIMVVLGDVCPATEDLILSFVPANMKALVQ